MTIPIGNNSTRRSDSQPAKATPPTAAHAGASPPTLWAINRLKENPHQKKLFLKMKAAEFRQLVEDMRKNGQRQAVHILPDGTIISGHERVRAAGELGWTNILVIVRNDLVGASDEAVTKELIMENVARRHLDPISLARSYDALDQLEPQAGRGDGNRLDKIAEMLGGQYSGRSLDRIRKLLRLPIKFQHLIGENQLTMDRGLKLLACDADRLLSAANEIESGGNAKTIIADLLKLDTKATDAGKVAGRNYRKVVDMVHRELTKLAEYSDLDSVVRRSGTDPGEVIQTIDAAIATLTAIRQTEARKYEQQAQQATAQQDDVTRLTRQDLRAMEDDE